MTENVTQAPRPKFSVCFAKLFVIWAKGEGEVSLLLERLSEFIEWRELAADGLRLATMAQ